ncbi:MarR family winged helix-turn-helix transcriptional regulator [Asanoa siamensis]|uniref:MarR family transcriptional regulator n=1 Tax=Asanoa siamensis TaxID=926357 RepID=A0ABQ4D1L7_9ACTN|nr:MarR family transcriptional regulator [Asanoa siamensis]GIF77153.1 MarR family transcriptional regulator [Asanoa siamensis]
MADLLDSSHWGPVWALLHGMDRDIAGLYAEAGIDDVRTRYVGPIIQLSRHEPLTIQQLADRIAVTHSAMSQTVSAMRRAGLVVDADNVDGRTRRIRLSPRGLEVVPFLVAEWRATETSLRELEAELPYALTTVVADIRRALERRSFAERLRANFSL